MLLIYPPSTLVSEPPSGLCHLAGFLKSAGVKYRLADLNRESLESFIHQKDECFDGNDTWTQRALKRRHSSWDYLTDRSLSHYDANQYGEAVRILQRVLLKGRSDREGLSLANYTSRVLSPLNSADLIRQFYEPELHPLFSFFSRRLDELIKEERPEHIGISLTFLNQALGSLALLGYLNREYPDIELTAGGGLVTTWKHYGFTEELLFELPVTWIGGDGQDFLADIVSPGHLPAEAPPDFDSVYNSSYLSPGFIMPYAASLGCPWQRCTFCPETAEKNSYSCISASRMVDELGALVSRYNPRLIHFTDSELSQPALKALAENPPGSDWYGFSRFHPVLEDAVFCRKLKDSGCTMLKLGLESGDQKVLEGMNKGINLTSASRILQNLREAGIMTYIYLLFGTPYEDEAAARKTLDFVVRHHKCISYLNTAIFNLPRGSALAGELELSAFNEKDMSLYADFKHPGGWGRRQVREFLKNEFNTHPDIRPIIKRDPPVMGSSHGALFRT